MTSNDSAGPDLGGLARIAALFVVAMAAVFGIIGLARDDTGGTEILDDPVAAESSAEPTATDEPADGATSTPTEPVNSDLGATPTETATATGTEAPSEGETGITPPATEIDAAGVTVQVLDGTSGGDGTDGVVADLEEGGYDVVAVNDSVNTYDRTTVFYTSGNEDAARQIAAEFGFSVVEEQPGNLSESVQVHVVVGDDA